MWREEGWCWTKDRKVISWQERSEQNEHIWKKQCDFGTCRQYQMLYLVLRLCSVSCLWVFKIRRTCKAPTRMDMWEVRNRFSGFYPTFFLKIHYTQITRKRKSLKYIAGYKRTMCCGHACQDLRIESLYKFLFQWHRIWRSHVYFPKWCFMFVKMMSLFATV